MHSAALVSEHASKELPSNVEGHLRNASTYINRSPKRSAELEDFQELYEVEASKILKFSTTRWLVVQPCVDRYLKIREPLLGFFRTAVRENPKDREACQILTDMQNPFVQAYLHFLSYVLTYMNEFNALFQSREILIHKLRESSLKLLNKMCQNFMLPSALRQLETLNVAHPSNFVSLDNVYLGPDCTDFLKTVSLPMGDRRKEEVDRELKLSIETFKVKCLNFYKKAAEEMKARLPLSQIFKEMSFLDPAVVLSSEVRVNDLPDLHKLMEKFREKLGLDLRALAQEWRTISVEIDGSLRAKLLSMSVEDAWSEISSLKNFQAELVFPQLSKLAECIMSLPHSNAEAERIFSMVTDIKTKKRNRMGAVCLNAIAVVRSSFQCKNVTCENFVVSEAHLKKFNSSIYKNQSSDDEGQADGA